MFGMLHDILRLKSGNSLDRADFDEKYGLFMVQRFLSMSSGDNVELLNDTVNSLYKCLDEREQYKLMETILPRTPTNGTYIKVPADIKKERLKAFSKKVETVDISEYFEESLTKIDESLAFIMGDVYE